MHPWFDDIGSTISSINADSGIPVVLRVLVLVDVLTFSFIHGITLAFIMSFISEGTPGRTNNISSPFRRNFKPLAEPPGFSITSPLIGTSAWLRLEAGIFIPSFWNFSESNVQ